MLGKRDVGKDRCWEKVNPQRVVPQASHDSLCRVHAALLMSDSDYSDYTDDSDFSSDSETTLEERGAGIGHRLVFIHVFASWTTDNLSARVTCVGIHSAYRHHLRSTVRRAREEALLSLTAGFSGLQARGPNDAVDYYLRIVHQATNLGYAKGRHVAGLGGATCRRLLDGPLLGIFVANGQGAFRQVAQAAMVRGRLEVRDV